MNKNIRVQSIKDFQIQNSNQTVTFAPDEFHSLTHTFREEQTKIGSFLKIYFLIMHIVSFVK